MLAGIDFNALENISVRNFPGGSIGEVIFRLLPYIYSIAGVMLLVYLLVGGFSLMTSKGDPKTIEAAKQKITYALLGFVIVFFSFWIIQIVGLLLGIDQIGVIF